MHGDQAELPPSDIYLLGWSDAKLLLTLDSELGLASVLAPDPQACFTPNA